ncbi:PspC domain-containing protein [Leptobacterium sp. I13]|uniref:PspC domain-containing protein n=1 Tax=Leptobacterium meishanense TaxID=3128904 RepID=UPI0030EB6088
MNKTVNINLAGTFFHIDEDAYLKLQRYLDAIKRSFSSAQGRDEIIADIEARVAELFAEKIQHDRQVISIKEVDAVIAVMGQPEDYLLDEEIFDDQPKTSRTYKERKQLYRDTEDKYIGGVCSGLGYYLGVDALWMRLIFILVTVFSGFGLIAYILFWILVPEASTTAQKLAMRGEAVNISNIEKKIKEGFDNVSEKVKNVDYEKVGSKVKSSSKTFFDTIGDIILFFFKIVAKFIGVILIITGASALIALFVGLFSAGIADIVHVPGVDFVDIFNTSGVSLWLASLLLFFAIGIPFFLLFYLGLKILVGSLKSMGNIAKFTLLGIWLLAIVGLIIIGARQASEHAYTGTTSTKEQIFVSTSDTLLIKMNTENEYTDHYYRNPSFALIVDENDTERIYSEDVQFNIRKSNDSLSYVAVRKEADGRTYSDARERAGKIDYAYRASEKTIELDDFLTTDSRNKFRDQEVDIDIYLPEGTVVKVDNSTYGNIGRSTKNDKGFYRSGIVGRLWKMGADGELKCLDCTAYDEETEPNSIRIDEEGLDINIKDRDGEEFKMKIDENGVKIKTN